MKICITGGAGYVGSVLTEKLIKLGHQVTVLDLFWYGKDVFPSVKSSPDLTLIEGDIRNPADLRKAFKGQNVIVHLACISNDPSFELKPNLGRSINYDAFKFILDEVKASQPKHFIYASSSSVYGVREEGIVTENSPCDPLTDYSKYKLMCEEDLKRAEFGKRVSWTILRPATVCGWSPRLRLDLVVNKLTIDALMNKKITVYGGDQLRPNINIHDMVAAYEAVICSDRRRVNKKTFNVGFENKTVTQIAEAIKRELRNPRIEIESVPSNDNRSYHIDSTKITQELGFWARKDLKQAVNSLVLNYTLGKIRSGQTNPMYYNIKRMQELNLGAL